MAWKKIVSCVAIVGLLLGTLDAEAAKRRGKRAMSAAQTAVEVVKKQKAKAAKNARTAVKAVKKQVKKILPIPEDELLGMLILAEAGSQPPEGQKMVAYVVVMSAKDNGESIRQEITKKNRYSPLNKDKKSRRYWRSINKQRQLQTKAYLEALAIGREMKRDPRPPSGYEALRDARYFRNPLASSPGGNRWFIKNTAPVMFIEDHLFSIDRERWASVAPYPRHKPTKAEMIAGVKPKKVQLALATTEPTVATKIAMGQIPKPHRRPAQLTTVASAR
ncbi:MAG TPA: hypothetical protein VD928_03905 [Candidatus Paceibacterota bacterium]|nr:hypothetical protein [Candidatus Paceibacterota bacterium]